MTRVPCFVLALALVAPAVLVVPTVSTAQEPDARSRAARETREALEAYRQALEEELQRLRGWLEATTDKVNDPETRRRLSKARDTARKKLDALADEAKRTWDDIKARMDDVVDDLRREYRQQAPKG